VTRAHIGVNLSQVEIIEQPTKTFGNFKTMAPDDSTAVVTLKKSDLERMLKPSTIMTADQVSALKREAEAKREADR
jgi:hypothetical protein